MAGVDADMVPYRGDVGAVPRVDEVAGVGVNTEISVVSTT